ncbi:hypothetical protein ACFL23_01295 [Patescibacteria group bacterium]
MISLNLIPSYKKEGLKFKKLYETIKILLYFLIFFVIITSIILSIANVILVNTFNDTVLGTSYVSSNHKIFDQDITTLNEQFKNIHELQNKFIFYDDLLITTTKLIPEGIKLDYLSVNTNLNTALFKGIATTRKNLIEFLDNLKYEKIFKSIESPLSNILEKENIAFTIKTNL